MAKKKFHITKEELENLYLVEQWSMKEIANHFGCSAQTICNLIEDYEIPARSNAKHTERTKQKLAELKTGNKHPFYGKKRPEHSKALIGMFVGRVFTEETKQKMSQAKNGLYAGKYRGETHPSWVSPNERKGELLQNIRRTAEMASWRRYILKRDKHTCLFCGKNNVKLNIDHIKTLYSIVIECGIKTLEEALKCELIWDTNNGRTLCVECHRKTDTYGRPKKS